MNPHRQKSSYCSEGASCVHVAAVWQKSSYCSEGNSCVHIASMAAPPTIRLTESGDPTHAVRNATPTAFGALIHVLKLNKEAPRD